MRKKIIVVAILINLSMILHAQSPLGNRGREWYEQDGYAIVNNQNYHYWLYSTEYFCNYHNWNRTVIGGDLDAQIHILRSALFQWVERQGWTIDYDNSRLFDPNKNLALSVKILMASRGTGSNFFDMNTIFMDISVTIVTDNAKKARLIINYWNFMKEDYYKTWVYPLIKF